MPCADASTGGSPTRRSGSLIRQALYLDQEDAYAAGEAVPPTLLGVGFLARALVQATLPHSDPKANEFVRRNGHFTLSILAPKDVGLPFGRYPRLVHSAAAVLVEGLRRAGRDLGRSELTAELEKFYRFETGLTPPITFSANRRIGALGTYVAAVDPGTGNVALVGGWIEPR